MPNADLHGGVQGAAGRAHSGVAPGGADRDERAQRVKRTIAADRSGCRGARMGVERTAHGDDGPWRQYQDDGLPAENVRLQIQEA